MPLEQYQHALKNGVYQAWNSGANNVCATMATGLGKSYTVAHIVQELAAPTTVIAHRTELVSQLSLSLAAQGVRHALSLPGKAIQRIVSEHIRQHGRSHYDDRSVVRVVSAQSVVDSNEPWMNSTRYWITDECHHLLKTNLWGRVVAKLPNARGLGVTATPIRAEGAGLGSHADGVFDALVEGPQLGEGIRMGFLTPYRIVCSESDIEIDKVPISDSTGDYNQVRLRDAVHRSKSLIGDMTQTYRKWTPGKAAIAFVVDIEEAGRVATAFKAAGIPAEAISSKTPTDLRAKIMDDFRARRLLVLVNVDLFGEGVDIPSLEVVIMARHTASLSLFLQQCLDSETEILTRRGWLRNDDLRDDDMVAAFDRDREIVEWCSILNRVSRPLHESEKMFSVKSPHLDIRVTGGHDMLVRSMSRTNVNWQKQPASLVASRKAMFRIPVSAVERVEDCNISDWELEFIGWYLSDGTINKKTRGLSISQSSSAIERCDRIRTVIRNCGFKFGEHRHARSGDYKNHADGIQFDVSYGKPRGRDKHLSGYAKIAKWLD